MLGGGTVSAAGFGAFVVALAAVAVAAVAAARGSGVGDAVAGGDCVAVVVVVDFEGIGEGVFEAAYCGSVVAA